MNLNIALLALSFTALVLGAQQPPQQGEIDPEPLGPCADGQTMNWECWLTASTAKRKANNEAATTLAESMESLLFINQKAVAACEGDEACIAASNANYVTLSQAVTLTYVTAKIKNQAAFAVAEAACCEDIIKAPLWMSPLPGRPSMENNR